MNPFLTMTDDELRQACREGMLRTVGDRTTLIARLNRHVARGGSFEIGRK